VTGLPLVGTGACDCGACDDLADAEDYTMFSDEEPET